MTSCPWNIYAEQLFPLGYGHPLWYPEPVGGREILIGDVGWFRTNGQFTPLFNVKSSREDPVNQQNGVPRGFTVFDSPGSRTVFTNPNAIMQRSLCSRTVQTREVEAELSAGSGDIAASGSFAFQTTADCGALVLLEPPAESADIESKRHIVNYMRRHFDSWLDFVNGQEGMGLGLEEQDNVFVSGTMKTTHWGFAAFQGNGSERKEGRIIAQFTPYATASLSVSLANASMPRSHYRYGPHPAQEVSVPVTISMLSQEVQQGLTSLKRNQCLFIHYYKMRRRRPLPKFAMRAAAGPHDLGSGSSDPGASVSASVASRSPSPDFVLDTLPDAEMLVDPVDHLLKYILDHSNAQMAVASDQDVIALLTDLSGEVYEGILHAAPEIEVDGSGVGTVVLDRSSNTRHKGKGEELAPAVRAVSPQLCIDLDAPPAERPSRLDHEILPQIRYEGPSAPFERSCIVFETVLGLGVNLASVLERGPTDLIDQYRPAFSPTSGVTSKVTLRMQINGLQPYQRQIMALRSDREAASISKGELALTIAHEMRRYLRSQYLSMKGTRINFDISIIYLTKLIRVSRGSWQPEFSVRRGTYASNGRVVQSIRQVGTETITWKRSTLPTT